MTNIRRNCLPALLFALSALVLLPCPRPSAGQEIPLDGFAARINDRVITMGDVWQLLGPIEERLRTRYRGRELEQELENAFRDALDMLIEHALILEDFERSEMVIPDAAVDEHIHELVRERYANDRAAFHRALAEQRMSMEDFRRQTREQMIIMLMQRQQVIEPAHVTEADVRRAYRERSDDFRRPSEVLLRLIVLNRGTSEEDRQAKLEEAERLRQRLQQGESFSELAERYSEGSRAARGGDMGWVNPSDLRPELEQAAESLSVGRHSEVIPAGDSLFLIKLEARRDESTIPFEEAREELREELLSSERERLYRQWIRRLRADFYIREYL